MAFAYMPVNGFDRSPEVEVRRAFNYLGRSALANDIIGDLSGMTAVITIQVGVGVEPKYRHPKVGETHGGIVEWDPEMSLGVIDKASTHRGVQTVRPKVSWVEQHEERYGLFNLKKRRTDKPGTLSPAVALMHELGHAYQFQQDPTAYRAEMKKFVNCLEDTNVAAIENTVCLELNEAGASEGLRWDYNHTA
jgi:hypothetical protein